MLGKEVMREKDPENQWHLESRWWELVVERSGWQVPGLLTALRQVACLRFHLRLACKIVLLSCCCDKTQCD